MFVREQEHLLASAGAAGGVTDLASYVESARNHR